MLPVAVRVARLPGLGVRRGLRRAAYRDSEDATMSDSHSDARAASQTVPSPETQAEPGVTLGLAAPTSTARTHTRPPAEPDRPQTWHYGLVAQWWAEFSE